MPTRATIACQHYLSIVLSACPHVRLFSCPPVAVTVSMLGRCHRAWPALPRYPPPHDSRLHPFLHLVPVLFMASAARVKPFCTARSFLPCCLSCSRQRSQLLLDTELGPDTARGGVGACQQAVTTGGTSETSLSHAPFSPLPCAFSVAIRYSFLDLLSFNGILKSNNWFC